MLANRRGFLAGLSGLFATLGFSRPAATKVVTAVVPESKVISLHLDPLTPGELWRKLSSCTLTENGYTTGMHADEMRDLAGALLRAADENGSRVVKTRSFVMVIPQDAAIEGRYGDFCIGFDPPHHMAMSGAQIGVILEPVNETFDRMTDEFGKRMKLVWDKERRLLVHEVREIGEEYAAPTFS